MSYNHVLDDLTEMIISDRKRKPSNAKKQSAHSIEKEFLAFAHDIAKYYPHYLQNKSEFISHLSKYITAGIKDYGLMCKDTDKPKNEI
jgi:hypothetical protein